MSFTRKLGGSAPSASHLKIAIAWSVSATLCLTGYYFARRWARDQREETVRIRKELDQQFRITHAKQLRLEATETPDQEGSSWVELSKLLSYFLMVPHIVKSIIALTISLLLFLRALMAIFLLTFACWTTKSISLASTPVSSTGSLSSSS